MSQLSFLGGGFKEKIITKKIDKTILKPRKLEDVNPIFLPNKYIIHPTGGWHYFRKCQIIPENNKYKQKIWPFISYQTEKNKIGISSVRWAPTSGYPTVSLDRADGRQGVPYYMHVIVAEAFVLKPISDFDLRNPKAQGGNQLEVAHIYDEDCCYLPEFLQWQMRGENQNGKKNRRPSIDMEWKLMLAQGSVKE
jgi:hypothetical protein